MPLPVREWLDKFSIANVNLKEKTVPDGKYRYQPRWRNYKTLMFTSKMAYVDHCRDVMTTPVPLSRSAATFIG